MTFRDLLVVLYTRVAVWYPGAALVQRKPIDDGLVRGGF